MAPKLNPKFQNWLSKQVSWVDPASVDSSEQEELVSLVEGGSEILPNADPQKGVAVLDFDISEQEFVADIRDRVDDIRELRIETRSAWRRYQRRLEDAEKEDGVDEFNAKAEAKDAKIDAQDKQERFEQLWAEVLRMRQMWRKHQKLKRREDEKSQRRFRFSEAEASAVGKVADRLDDHREREEEHRRDIGKELDRAGSDVEVDFDDIDESVAELERAHMGALSDFETEPDTDREEESTPPERV